jgi:nitroreductase
MIDRRGLMAVGVGVVGASTLKSSKALASTSAYENAISSIWAPLRVDGGLKELVRYATLAANSHNTQPWTFKITDKNIVIAPDLSRRCPAVDPDDHHLFVSLGCATENLVHAAAAAGLNAVPEMSEDTISITLEPMVAKRSALFEAIPIRQSTRAVFDGKPIVNETLRLLEQAGTGKGVAVIIMTDQAKVANIAEYVIAGNSVQMSDPAFMTELKSWMRFNDVDALSTMDGLFSRASGSPTVPHWLAGTLLRLVFTKQSENAKYLAQLKSSTGVAVFVSDRNDKSHWIEAGRACQRFALQATALGLKCAFINQPVEVAAIRGQFATYLCAGDRRPDLVMRFGHAQELPRSLRRPVAQVISHSSVG